MVSVLENSNNKLRPDISFYGFRGGPGGISLTLISLMNEMACLGYRIHLLLHNTRVPEKKYVHPSIRTVKLPDGGLIKRARHLSYYIKESQPKAMISVREPGNRAITLAKTFYKARSKVVFRVGMPLTTALKRRALVKRMLRAASIRYCYTRADMIIANHVNVAEDIAHNTGIPIENIPVIPNGTVSAFLYEQAKANPEHPWLNRKEAPVVLGIGRLARQKDFTTLIRAFCELKKKINARLLILGEGKERISLAALIDQLGLTGSVDLYGHTDNPYAFLARADLFVLSSVWEGLPNALIEAMALGISCVATDCRSGPREILENGKYGHLVPVGDHRTMADAMYRALLQPLDPDFIRSGASRYEAGLCARRYLEALDLV
ncbi:MAG: glycosyltransferase [Deltaproteobacteria bacterium]|nr:MAG: glycosyltransferase [Deltaproteobacteria bacterium]